MQIPAILLGLVARHWLVLTVISLAVITFASLSVKGSAGDPGEADKTAHLLAYGVLALPVGLARPRAWPAILAVLLAWSGAIEVLQPSVGRSGSAGDLLANAAGLAAGTVMAALLRRFLPKLG